MSIQACGDVGRTAALESEGYRVDFCLLLLICRSVLKQDTEPLTAPDEHLAWFHGVNVCVNVCVNGRM